MNNGQRLHHIRSHALSVRDSYSKQISLTATAVSTIGGLLSRNLNTDDVHLQRLEVEGLLLALESLGTYLNEFCEQSLEHSAKFMLEKIEEMEAEPWRPHNE